ncbi:MAG: thiamine diphosphokinase [Lachnospiraceae bacterium]|nr:thiamine diphosphokinase [Lachnospiraceae bacterium]
MKSALIISGGSIEREFALPYMKRKKYDCIIAADRGLLFLKENQIMPTHIVGDFDSADASWLETYRENPEVEIRRFHPEKDWTDTEIAVELALELSCSRIDILGATGSRIDHVIGNIQVLSLARAHQADCCLVDSRNRIYLINSGIQLQKNKQHGNYVSLFAYGGDVQGLTLKGFKYPLDHFTLGTVGTRGVSNEIIEETASISFDTGQLLVIESRD